MAKILLFVLLLHLFALQTKGQFSWEASNATKFNWNENSAEDFLSVETSTTSTFDLNESDPNSLSTTTQTYPSLSVDYGAPDETTFQLPVVLRTTATVVCVIILLFGVTGNILVPFVVCRTRELCTNSTNVFLINLSVADLLVLIVCMPTVLIELHSRPEVWTLGEGMCKFFWVDN